MAIQDRARDFAGRTRDVASSLSNTARRQSRRAQLELEHRRLQGRLRKQYAVIGEALLPRIKDGSIAADDAAIADAITSIDGLQASLEHNRKELASTGGPLPVGEASFPGDEEL